MALIADRDARRPTIVPLMTVALPLQRRSRHSDHRRLVLFDEVVNQVGHAVGSSRLAQRAGALEVPERSRWRRAETDGRVAAVEAVGARHGRELLIGELRPAA